MNYSLQHLQQPKNKRPLPKKTNSSLWFMSVLIAAPVGQVDVRELGGVDLLAQLALALLPAARLLLATTFLRENRSHHY